MRILVFIALFGFSAGYNKNFGPEVNAPTKLEYGDFMTSNNSQFHAIMQQDGNFVIYRGSLADKSEDAWWNTRTTQRSNGPYYVQLQNDNNLVLYDFDKRDIWRAKTLKGIPPPRLKLNDDGNLIMYDSNNKKIWWTERELKGRLNRVKPGEAKKKRIKQG